MSKKKKKEEKNIDSVAKRCRIRAGCRAWKTIKAPNGNGISTCPASSFGSQTIRPAFANSKSTSLAKAAAAPHAQYTGGFKFSEDIPSSGQTKAEFNQAGRGIGDDDIPRLDDKARANEGIYFDIR